MPPLNEQLDALVTLQDIDLMLRDSRDPEMATHETRLGFARGNVEGLEQTRERLRSQIDEPLLRTYERMSRLSVSSSTMLRGAAPSAAAASST